MATLTQNGINFTLNADSIGKIGEGKYTHSVNFDDSTGYYSVDQNRLNNLGVSMSFNAVEIDWNDAELGKTIEVTSGTNLSRIKTTGGLIKVIQR